MATTCGSVGDPEKWGGMHPWFLCFNRNKRDIAIDFKTQEGRRLSTIYAKTCHVFVEGARPGASAKLGLGYEDLRAVNPKIVYCSITGFGQTGPFAQLATHGGAYDAVTGLSVPHELEDGGFVQYRPFPHGWMYGSWLVVPAVLGALLRAQTTGEGAYLDISCADATLMGLSQEILSVLNGEAEGMARPRREPLSKILLLQDQG